jgi:hypothetical protein
MRGVPAERRIRTLGPLVWWPWILFHQGRLRAGAGPRSPLKEIFKSMQVALNGTHDRGRLGPGLVWWPWDPVSVLGLGFRV